MNIIKFAIDQYINIPVYTSYPFSKKYIQISESKDEIRPNPLFFEKLDKSHSNTKKNIQDNQELLNSKDEEQNAKISLEYRFKWTDEENTAVLAGVLKYAKNFEGRLVYGFYKKIIHGFGCHLQIHHKKKGSLRSKVRQILNKRTKIVAKCFQKHF